MNKLLIIIFSISIFSCSTTNNHTEELNLYNEVLIKVGSNLIKPISEEYMEIRDKYNGYGYKINPFLGKIIFKNYSIYLCPNDTLVYAIIDGEINYIGFDQKVGFNKITIIKDDIEIEYFGIIPYENIHLNDKVEEGYIIGKVAVYGMDLGPRLLLKFKCKGKYLDPSIFMK